MKMKLYYTNRKSHFAFILWLIILIIIIIHSIIVTGSLNAGFASNALNKFLSSLEIPPLSRTLYRRYEAAAYCKEEADDNSPEEVQIESLDEAADNSAGKANVTCPEETEENSHEEAKIAIANIDNFPAEANITRSEETKDIFPEEANIACSEETENNSPEEANSKCPEEFVIKISYPLKSDMKSPEEDPPMETSDSPMKTSEIIDANGVYEDS